MTATRARGRLSGGLFILLAGDREQHLALSLNSFLTLFRLGSRSTGLLSAGRLHTLAQCLHQVHHIGACRLPWSLYVLALLLLAQQLLQRIFVVILKLLGFETSALGVHDVDRQVQHVLWDLLVVDGVEILLRLADLVGIPQRHTDHAVVSRFERNDMFTRCEDDLAECNHPFLADGLADHRKGLLPDFAIWNDEVRVAQVEFVDLRLRDELVNLDDAFAFNGDRIEFLWFKLEILALGDLVAFDDVGTLHIVPGYGIDFPVADAIAGIFIELVEADLFPLGRSWKQRDGTRDER